MQVLCEKFDVMSVASKNKRIIDNIICIIKLQCKYYFVIINLCYLNGKRFAFCQNEYILRASRNFGGDSDGKYDERVRMYI